MTRFVSILICLSTSVFVSCGSASLGSDLNTGSSGNGESQTGGSSGNVSFNRPDNLTGDSPSDDSYVRIIVELRSVEEGGPTYDYVNTINLNALSSVDIPDMEHGVYDVYAWADSFSSDKDVINFYCADNLSDISFEAADYNAFGLAARTAYYVSQKNVTINGENFSLDMKLPHAGYEILLQNPSEKVGKTGRGFKAKVSYMTYLPSSFNVYNQNVTDSVTGISYSVSLPEITSQMSELCVGKDIVFCGPRGSFVTAVVTVSDSEGNVCYQSDSIQISLENGKVRTLTLM